MTTAATWQICRWLTDVLADDDRLRPERMLLEGKPEQRQEGQRVSMLAGRGNPGHRGVRAVPRHSGVGSQDHRRAMVKAHAATVLGAQQAGMTGYGVNAANIIAALFVATGQDIACVHESGVSIYSMESDGDDLIATILLPNLVIGTVGGGTALPHQREWLTALGCAGRRRPPVRRDRRRFRASRSTCPPGGDGQRAVRGRAPAAGPGSPGRVAPAADLNATYLRGPLAERARRSRTPGHRRGAHVGPARRRHLQRGWARRRTPQAHRPAPDDRALDRGRRHGHDGRAGRQGQAHGARIWSRASP